MITWGYMIWFSIWLVVEPYSEKYIKMMDFIGMMKFPTEWTNNPFMFQTTNQIKTLISKNHLVQYYGARENGGYCCLWPLERPKRLHSTPINRHQAWENSDHRPWKKKQLPICHHDTHPTKWSQHGILLDCLEHLEEPAKLDGNRDMFLCTLW